MNSDNFPITNFELLMMVLTNPVKAFRLINEYKYDYNTIAIILVTSIVSTLDSYINKTDLYENSSFIEILVSFLTTLIVLSIVLIFISYILSSISRIFDGKGSTQDVLRLILYTIIPAILGFFVIKLPLYAIEKSYFEFSDNALYFYKYFISIWAMILNILAFSEAAKISIMKSILVFIIFYLNCTFIVAIGFLIYYFYTS